MTSQSNRLPVGALIVLAAIGFTAITTELLPSGLLPQISADFRVSEATAGYLTAGYAAIIVVTVIPLSLLLSRVPRHYLLIALILFFAASNALVAIVSDFGAAMGSRMVGGIAHGLLWSAMAPFVARIVPAHKVGKALAIVFSGNSLRLAIGAPVGTALGNVVGWRAAFLVLAASGVVLALLAVWLLPPVRRIPDAAHPSIRKAIGQPGVKTVAVAWPLMLMAHFALFTYIAPFLREVRLPDFSIPLSISVLGVAGLVGIWIAGVTVDSRPRRWLLITVAGVVVSVALLPLVGSVLPALALPVTLVLMLVWGTGIGDGDIQPVRYPPRRRRVQRRRQRADGTDHPDRDHDRRDVRRRCPHRCGAASGPDRRRHPRRRRVCADPHGTAALLPAGAKRARQRALKSRYDPSAAEMDSSTRSTRPGAFADLSQSRSLWTCCSGPSASMDTEPSSRFLTTPLSPSSSALPIVQKRNPTPCTTPKTRAESRMSPLSRPGISPAGISRPESWRRQEKPMAVRTA
ncbi:UNVERIFIED_ORG: putative MFS family arabinose efflux permease [Arthrobacter sp. UYEF13]